MRRLDVFGRPFLATYAAAGWQIYDAGADGKRGPPLPLAVPAFVRTGDELLTYLADLFHESATPARPDVRWVD